METSEYKAGGTSPEQALKSGPHLTKSTHATAEWLLEGVGDLPGAHSAPQPSGCIACSEDTPRLCAAQPQA